MERILITGGSGFIGTNLVERCRVTSAGTVRAVDVLRPRAREHEAHWTRANIMDPVGVSHIFAEFKPTVVFHLAARTDLHGTRTADYQENIQGTRNVVNAVNSCESVSRAVFASSRMVCRLGHSPLSDEDYSPPNAYGESKVEGERIVRTEARDGVWVLVRPTSIWGPWFGVPYRDFFDSVLRGYFFGIRGRPSAVKSFGYVGNTVFQLLELVKAPRPVVAGRTFYLADFVPTVVSEFANLIRRSSGDPPIWKVPFSLVKAAAVMGDLAKNCGWHEPPLTSFRLRNLLADMIFDLSELQAIVGPLPYSLEEGVVETLAWMRRHD